ncbi:uncharacterized protein EDB91DRAFT_1333283 [Suillus paluster]|uniref:uncharacterized protein n=1 Tax=Suillus paluster TaxID=48578 RepID=UPI001B87A265|nr:uncharacterized protein EDB91DRAFT_1333283 [Suillus paluster]KAG1753984.1 hypothetical protein EDB91DRAFT_1333283 [Suillus paluster]
MDNDGDIPVYSERHLALFQLVKDALDDLPVLHASVIPKDESCAICLTPFDAILAGEVPQEGEIEDGVTQVAGCGHLFCRKDLSEWIRNFHGSCPTCRHPFLDIKPYTESDAESSDDEYFPDDEDEEEDDFFGMDDFDDEFEVEEMEVDLDDIWGYVDLNAGDESDDEEEDPEPDIDGLLEENLERSRSVSDADDDVEADATCGDSSPRDK